MADKSILIIDDDQTLVAAIKEGLETLGFRVSAAFDGLQGVLQAHQGRPDAIMLDFNMPAGGGAGVYERLRTSSVTAQTPIIFLTAATVEDVKKVIRSTPNTYFLKKPISVTQLRKVLDKILGGGAPPPSRSRPVTLGPSPLPASPVIADDFAGLGGLPSPPTPLPAPTPSPLPTPGGRGMAPTSLPPAPLPSPSQPFAGGAPFAPAPPAPAPFPAAPAGGGLEGQVHAFTLRVPYGDTDRLGIVYYGNYLRYFETGRTELMRAAGIRYRDLEMERRIFLPAVECRVQYVAPCRYDDQLRVRTWLSWLGPASVCFQNEILNQDENGRLVARGFTRHAVLNENWRPARIPPDLKQRLGPLLKTD